MQRRFHLTRGELFAYRAGSGWRENWVSRWVLPRAPRLARNVRRLRLWRVGCGESCGGRTGPEVARTAHGGTPRHKRPIVPGMQDTQANGEGAPLFIAVMGVRLLVGS